MTDSEHAALSAELARALGWTKVQIIKRGYWKFPKSPMAHVTQGNFMRWFDYRAPDVYGPLIEFLLLEGVNVWNPDGIPTVWEWSEPIGDWGRTESFPEAVARAVIAISRDPRE